MMDRPVKSIFACSLSQCSAHSSAPEALDLLSALPYDLDLDYALDNGS